MTKFLNSEIAQAEENETVKRLAEIAKLESEIIALKQVIGEMAIENAKLRVSLEIMKHGEPNG